MADPQDILAFWTALGPSGWYAVDPVVDDRIRAGYTPVWQAALGGAFAEWQATPDGALAYLILTDQFPRNMFRGDGRSFATDPLALAAARAATAQGLDLRIEPPLRQFFYMPFMHAETLADQDHAIALFTARMPDPDHLKHARAHREVIRRFARFPYRNIALGRAMTSDEQAFLDAGGYGALVRDMT